MICCLEKRLRGNWIYAASLFYFIPDTISPDGHIKHLNCKWKTCSVTLFARNYLINSEEVKQTPRLFC